MPDIPGYPSPLPSYVRSYVPLPIQLIGETANETTRRYDAASEQLDNVRRALQAAQVAPSDRAAWDRRVGAVNGRIDALAEDGILSNKLSQVRGISRDLEGEYGTFQRNQGLINADQELIRGLEASGDIQARMLRANSTGYTGLEDPATGQLTNFYSPRYTFSNEADFTTIALEAVKALEAAGGGGGLQDIGGGMYARSSSTVLSPERVQQAAALALRNSPEAQGHMRNLYNLYLAEHEGATPEQAQQYVQEVIGNTVNDVANTYAYDRQSVDYGNYPRDENNGTGRGTGSGTGSGTGTGNSQAIPFETLAGAAFTIPQQALSFNELHTEFTNLRTSAVSAYADVRQRLNADGYHLNIRDETGRRGEMFDLNNDVEITDAQGNVVENDALYDQVDIARRRFVQFRNVWDRAQQNVIPRLRERFNDDTLYVDAQGQIQSRRGNLADQETRARREQRDPAGIGIDMGEISPAGRVRAGFESAMQEEINRLRTREPVSHTLIGIPATGQEGEANINYFSTATGLQFHSIEGGEVGSDVSADYLPGGDSYKPDQVIHPVGFTYTEEYGNVVQAEIRQGEPNHEGYSVRRVMLTGDTVNEFVRNRFTRDPQGALYATLAERLAFDIENRDEIARFNNRDISAVGLNQLRDGNGELHSTDAIRGMRVRRGQSGYYLTVNFSDSSRNIRDMRFNSLQDLVRNGFSQATTVAADIANVDLASSRPSVSFGGEQGGAPLDRVIRALTGHESGDNSEILNGVTSAIGLGQIMPSNVGPWTQRWAGRRMSPSEFRADPQAQRQVIQGELGSYLEQFTRRSGNPQTGLRMALCAWYSGAGNANQHNDDRPVWNRRGANGGYEARIQYGRPPGRGWEPYPSRKEYVDRILARLTRS